MRLHTAFSERIGPFPEQSLAGAKAKEASDLLKAMAHESRLKILCILRDSERSVSELENMLDLRQPTVSQQLARLRADGLVHTRRDGKTIYYSLASADARHVIDAVQDIFCDRPD